MRYSTWTHYLCSYTTLGCTSHWNVLWFTLRRCVTFAASSSNLRGVDEPTEHHSRSQHQNLVLFSLCPSPPSASTSLTPASALIFTFPSFLCTFPKQFLFLSDFPRCRTTSYPTWGWEFRRTHLQKTILGFKPNTVVFFIRCFCAAVPPCLWRPREVRFTLVAQNNHGVPVSVSSRFHWSQIRPVGRR